MYLAHAFGARYELPLPLICFVVGAAAVVAGSFVLVLPRAVRAVGATQSLDQVRFADSSAARRIQLGSPEPVAWPRWPGVPALAVLLPW